VLPRRFRLDASDDFFVVDEAVEEIVPGFGRPARIGKLLPQLIDAIVGRAVIVSAVIASSSPCTTLMILP